MKKNFLFIAAALLLLQCTNAQSVKGITSQDNWLNFWTNFKPSVTEYQEATEILTGTIDTDLKLSKATTYLLVGPVYVTKKAVLTIEKGTVIRGDKASCGTLVITQGSKIMAEGQITDPIVFTSNSEISERKPGDWGGIVILGDAPINKIGGMGYLDYNLEPSVSYYGGQNPNSNSGILSYVRIEFAGRKLNATKELNGLSMAGVGKETKIENIQISFSNDDSFECYGGDVVMKNLVSYRATDDDFDFTEGVQGNIYNSIAIRNPFSSDSSGSRCFEIDSYDKITTTDLSKKLTKVNANNICLVNIEDNNQGLVREAIYIKENSYLSLNNSIISGFKTGILLFNKVGTDPANLAKISIQNSMINQCEQIVSSENSDENYALSNWYNSVTFSLDISKSNNADLFRQYDIKKNPDFRLKNRSVIASNN